MTKKANFKCASILALAEEWAEEGNTRLSRATASVLMACYLNETCEYSKRCERATERMFLNLNDNDSLLAAALTPLSRRVDNDKSPSPSCSSPRRRSGSLSRRAGG